jgi:diguanylate cyclase (GGDEF)-like protein
MIDPLTTFVLATIYMLLIGAVLGFMHRVLPKSLQAPAADWRIGTLLVAGGGILLASRGVRAVDWVIPLANGCILLGLTLYWRAVRRYLGLPARAIIYAPVVVTLILIMIFVFAYPNYGLRVLIGSLGGAAITTCAIINLMRNRQVEFTMSSRVLSALFLLSGGFMIGRGIYVFLHSTDADTLLLPSNPINALTPLFISLLPTVGTTAFLLLLFERIRRDLHHVATTDPLTELPNRRTLNEHARAFFSRPNAESTPRAYAVALVDIDHFKRINDSFGHDVGDLVLQRVAAALRSVLRGHQLVGRQGGEEFVALLEGASLQDGLVAAERLRRIVENTDPTYGEKKVPVTISIGVAAISNDDETYETLLQRADRALYVAKNDGRNCVRHVDTTESQRLHQNSQPDKARSA